MKNIRSYLLVLCALTIFGVSFLLYGAGYSRAASDKDVVVVNTSSNPVPVSAQGTTNIAGSVSVSNTPNVNIANSPTVTLNNSAANPLMVRDVDNPARQAFQNQISFNVPQASLTCLPIATVPGGKRLVIEYASLSAFLNIFGDETVPFAFLEVVPASGPPQHFQLDVDQTSNPHAYRVAQQVRFYADSPSVQFCVQVDGTNGGPANAIASVSGYFVNL